MMRRVQLATIVGLLLASSSKAFQLEWIKLEPLGGGFSVMMPDKPLEGTKAGNDFSIHLYTVNAADGIYIASYGDYAPSFHLDVDTELVENRDNFLKSLNAKMTDSKRITMDGRSGLEFTAESDDAVIKSRLYLFGNRVHQIAVAITNGRSDSENVKRFFASFTFTGVGRRPKS